MAEMKKEEEEKMVETRERGAAEQEAVGMTMPSAEEKPPEEGQQEGAKGMREAVAEVPREEAAPEESPSLEHAILAQCMKDTPLRQRVLYHLVKKLR